MSDDVPVIEATSAVAARIACKEIDGALAELESEEPDMGHVFMHLHSAKIWLADA